MQNYNNLSPKMINRTLLSLQGNQYTIYTIWYYYLLTERKHRPELIVCLYYQPESTEQIIETFYKPT